MYSGSHRILLVGEGDFSFSLCLARRFNSAANMVATSIDSRETLLSNYSKAGENLRELEELGCTILHGVDAHYMSEHACLKMQEFDRIVFNFPHAGFPCREKDRLYICLHQNLVLGFFKCAKKLLANCGEVHVTHKTSHPFSRWGIEEFAEMEGLYLKSKVPFFLCDYPGYQNKKGSGEFCDSSFPVGACSTYQFTMN